MMQGDMCPTSTVKLVWSSWGSSSLGTLLPCPVMRCRAMPYPQSLHEASMYCQRRGKQV